MSCLCVNKNIHMAQGMQVPGVPAYAGEESLAASPQIGLELFEMGKSCGSYNFLLPILDLCILVLYQLPKSSGI